MGEGVVVSLRPGGSQLGDVHAWIDEQRAAGADAFMVVAIDGRRGSVQLREFGAEVHGSVHATVAMIVMTRAINEFRPMFADPPDEG